MIYRKSKLILATYPKISIKEEIWHLVPLCYLSRILNFIFLWQVKNILSNSYYLDEKLYLYSLLHIILASQEPL